MQLTRHSGLGTREGKELTPRARGKAGPVAQADNDDRLIGMSLPGRPPPRADAYGAQVHGLVVENRVRLLGLNSISRFQVAILDR